MKADPIAEEADAVGIDSVHVAEVDDTVRGDDHPEPAGQAPAVKITED